MQWFIPTEECDFCNCFDHRYMRCGLEESGDTTEAECLAVPELFAMSMEIEDATIGPYDNPDRSAEDSGEDRM